MKTETPQEATVKRCTKCTELKPLEMFSRDKNRSSGRRPHCKACNAVARKIYYQANAERERAAARAWGKANPMYRRAWYHLNIDKEHIRTRAWRQANPGKSKARTRAWRQANPNHDALYRQSHREKHSYADRAYRAANLDKMMAKDHSYRALRAGVESSFTADDLALLKATQRPYCAYCQRAETLQIDHIIPLDLGGPNTPANICLACRKCNLSKGNRTLDQWLNRWYWREIL